MAIDPIDAPFTLHVIGETTGKTYTGEFRAKKRLTHRDQLRKDQVRRELLGGAPGVATDRALSTSMILSELAVRLTAWPEWWATCERGLDLEDDKVVGVLHDEAIKIESESIEAKRKAAEKLQEELRVEAEKKKAEEQG